MSKKSKKREKFEADLGTQCRRFTEGMLCKMAVSTLRLSLPTPRIAAVCNQIGKMGPAGVAYGAVIASAAENLHTTLMQALLVLDIRVKRDKDKLDQMEKQAKKRG